ncbi:hypothetical protein DY037_07270 [Apilactobacillus micheneri]|uniref:hypothetical protein n=1 Tax=Apilactobacillus micheneri TaxID=1899430 RepID=UPI00112C2426|nr:hypothetical protein [Apilactobacillus micheneri]TPR48184.1 hypothetical protein DY037_07270 [Apilactobacillus micheneri]
MQEFTRKSSIQSQVILFMTDKDREDENTKKVLSFVINKVAQDTANYLNVDLNDIPEKLDGTLTGLVTQYLDTHQCLPSQQQNSANLQSLTEGDVSYSYKTPGEIYQGLQAANTITDNYIPILNNFRKLPWS